MESIQFPALGLEFSVNPVLAEFTVFGIPFSIRWYGLLIAVGFLLAVLYAAKTAKKRFATSPYKKARVQGAYHLNLILLLSFIKIFGLRNRLSFV